MYHCNTGLGAIPVPGTSLLVPKDIAYRAGASSATAFIGDSTALERFQSVATQCKTVRTALLVRLADESGAVPGSAKLWQDLFNGVPEGAKWDKPGGGPKDLSMICGLLSAPQPAERVLIVNREQILRLVTGCVGSKNARLAHFWLQERHDRKPECVSVRALPKEIGAVAI
jgi:hypothetical protein